MTNDVFKPTDVNFLHNNYPFPFYCSNDFFASFSNRSEFKTTAKKFGEIRMLGSINGIMTAFNKDFYFTLDELGKYLKLISVKKFLIMVVEPDKENDSKMYENCVRAKYNDGVIKIEMIILSYTAFLRLFSFSSLIHVGENTVYNPSDILFFFRKISWSLLVYDMKERNNIIITGGINAKRHISSTLTARHINYLLPFFDLNMKLLNNCIENNPWKELSSVEPKHFKDLKWTKEEKDAIEQRKIEEENKWQALTKDSKNKPWGYLAKAIAEQKRNYHMSTRFLLRNSYIVRYFSSTSHPSKLIINSTYNNIVFVEGKSILILPSLTLKEFFKEMNFDGANWKQSESDEGDSPLFDQLGEVLKNLGTGEYSFEFYFYIESRLSNYFLKDIYTFYGFHKDCLNRIGMCSYGYKKLMKITLKLFDGVWIFQLLFISEQLGKGLSSLQSSSEFRILLDDKDVVLVIKKLS